MRQLCRLRDVRAPDAPNADSLNQAAVRRMASTAEDMEQYNSAVISQIRLAQGSQGWTQPPEPSSTTGGTGTNANGYPSASGREILGEMLSGDQDGANRLFALSHNAVPQSVRVFYNSLRLGVGQEFDYVVEETVPGKGFAVIRLTGAVAPLPRDRLWADYAQA